MECAAVVSVLGNSDLLLAIFEHMALTPIELVRIERVCRQWRSVYHANARALVQAATPAVLTKTVLMGLYGLSSSEANQLPHTIRARRDGGHMCLFSQVSERAWALVGTERDWEGRLIRRGAYQASVERAFGPNWRNTRWLPYRRPSTHMAFSHRPRAVAV